MIRNKLFKEYEDNISKDNIGFVLFKPNYQKKEINNFITFSKKNNFKIIEHGSLLLDKKDVLILYSSTFKFLTSDLFFGIKWKKAIIRYLTSGPSMFFMLKGAAINSILSDFKIKIRSKYGKITRPKKKLDPKDFVEKVIKNIIISKIYNSSTISL